MTADHLFFGARFLEGTASEGASAFAVRDGRFLAVGTDAELEALRGAGTALHDLGGRVVIPGLHDAHTHLAGAALELAGLDLRDCATAEAVAERVRRAAGGRPPETWIRGFGWNEASWAAPGRDWAGLLDAVAPRHPVALSRIDGHAVWLNASAGREAGLADGRARVVEEAAADLLRRRVPKPPREESRSALVRALEGAAAVGLTTIQDVVEAWAIPLYAELHAEGALPVRAGLWLPIDADEEEADALRRRFPAEDPWLTVTTRKVFLDGTLGGRGAALEEPYADEPSRAGDLLLDERELRERVRKADAAGWAVAFHAVGDRAVRAALDAIERLPPANRRRHHRIEHAQVVRRDDLPRFRRLGVAASVQPLHWLEDAPWIESRLGRREGFAVYPWRSLRAHGTTGLAIGTDWPVASLDPLHTFEAVARRAARPGGDGEALTAFEALAAYSEGSAAAAGLGADRGRLAPGHRADFLVLASAVGTGASPPPLRAHDRYLGGVLRVV